MRPTPQQWLRCHAPSPLLATPARSCRCAAPYEIEKLVAALLLWPWNEQDTVARPPVPDDSMCQVHPTTPLLPTDQNALGGQRLWQRHGQ
jgi:hypothetical protein